MPVKIEDKLYAHPLSQNLYGLNFSKQYIKEQKKCFLFEGEFSPISIFPSHQRGTLYSVLTRKP